MSSRPPPVRKRISFHELPAARRTPSEPLVDKIRESGTWRLKEALSAGVPAPDYGTAMTFYRAARIISDNFPTMGDYVANLLAEFEHVESCSIYIMPKKKEDEGSISGMLEHRLTAVRDGGYFVIDESSEGGNLTPTLLSARDKAFRERSPKIIDYRERFAITFDDLDMNNRDCTPRELAPSGRDDLGEPIIPKPEMVAFMPFYYRDHVSPSGIVVFEGDLRCRNSKTEGILKTFWSANATMLMAQQIAFMLTHKYDAITILPQMADFEADLKDGIKHLVQKKIKNLYLISIDVDRFKNVNDKYGHPVGNKVLRCVAETIRASVRADDLVSRVSGDEFAVIARNVNSETEALAIAERIRRSISEASVPTGINGDVSVTCSIGITKVDDIAELILSSGNIGGLIDDIVIESIYKSAFKSADMGMYMAKTDRNKVRFNNGASLDMSLM